MLSPCGGNLEVRVFSGASGGVTAPTKNFAPVTMVEIRLDRCASVRQDLPADYNAVIVVIEGDGSIGAEATFAATSDVAWRAGQTFAGTALCRSSIA